MYREKWVAVSLILSAGVYLVLLFLPHFAFTQTRVPLRIVSNTELVQLAVLVFDERGAVATNLRKQDFRIVEDGEEQNIINCERERVSVSFVIVADVSSSMTNKIPFVQQAALDLVEPPDPQQGYTDEFSVLGIDTGCVRWCLLPRTATIWNIDFLSCSSPRMAARRFLMAFITARPGPGATPPTNIKP